MTRSACLLTVFLCSSTSVFAQYASPDPRRPFVLDLSSAYSEIVAGGSWNDGEAYLTWRRAPATVVYLFSHRGQRPEGDGSFLGLGATHDWTPRIYTYAALSFGVDNASFVPEKRLDLDLAFKLLESKRLVTMIGFTTASYPGHRHDDVASLGAIHYGKIIWTYRYFQNFSYPGRVVSHSQLVQAAIERPRTSAYLQYSWGNEAYQLTNLVSSERVDIDGHTLTIFARQWTFARGGFVGQVERQSKGDDFERYGARIGFFVSF